MLQTIYVLHSRRYGDSSLLVEMFGPDAGRVAGIAKGVLKGRRSGPNWQPFQPLLVELRGRGEVQTVGRCESAGPPLPLQGRAIYCGMYLNELLLRLTARHDPSPGLFTEYVGALERLSGNVPIEPVLRRFEVRLLGHLGLGLSLSRDTQGRPLISDSHYTYDVETGCALCRANEAGAVSGTTLLALASGEFPDADSLREARVLMRRVLNHHLDGKPLVSRELFR